MGLYGLYGGVVTDNKDPQKRKRIRAVSPVFGNDIPTNWARPCLPFAGPGHGMVNPPEVGTPVFLQFIAGDPDQPIYVGCGWTAPNNQTTVPDELQDDKVYGFKTPGGHQVKYSDVDGLKYIEIKTSGGVVLKLNDQNGQVMITSKKILFEADETSEIVTKNAKVKSDVTNLESGEVLIGNRASASAVLGEALQEYIDTHLHFTVLGPSGPPAELSAIKNATPEGFLSKCIKLKENT